MLKLTDEWLYHTNVYKTTLKTKKINESYQAIPI